MVPLVTLLATLAHRAPWSRGWSGSPMRTGKHPAGLIKALLSASPSHWWELLLGKGVSCVS